MSATEGKGRGTKKYLDLYHRLRALSEIDPESADSCWLWKGVLRGRTKNYPRMNIWADGVHRSIAVHRAALVIAEIDGDWECFWPLYQLYLLAGFEADHRRCNNPRCVNGDHLKWETKEDHLALTLARRRVNSR